MDSENKKGRARTGMVHFSNALPYIFGSSKIFVYKYSWS